MANLSRKQLEKVYLEEAELVRRRKQRKLFSYYPESGPLSRFEYPKHMEFLAAGAVHRERCALAANRIGKTEGMGGYETTLHLTGHYPKWWVGRRFDSPVNVIAAGITGKETRNVIQTKLMGPMSEMGTGLIPGDKIEGTTKKPGVPNALEQVWVKHSSGGISELNLMSYDQGWEAFAGTERDVIWMDEEPPLDVYVECLLRTMTTDGIIMLTFTPLKGISEVVMLFMPDGKLPDGGVIENAEIPDLH